VLARDADKIRAIQPEVGALPADYTDDQQLEQVLKGLVREAGRMDSLILWLHLSGLRQLDSIIQTSLKLGGSCYHICSSSVADPSLENPGYLTNSALAYRRVILGYKRESNHSRWLTHAEISNGVYAAIKDAGQEDFIVGQVRPWELRP
jgi:NAD(P)-dependent dehydrogenase (short-subunit alcohol dehydrogenase family)